MHNYTGMDCSGILITELPTIVHNVSGLLYIEDDTTLCISNFYYDGTGPDMSFIPVCSVYHAAINRRTIYIA